MIYDGKDPNYEEVIKTSRSKSTPLCRHDFWDQAPMLEFGDVILCQRCGQYFSKIKNIPCLIDKGNFIRPAHITRDVFVKVAVRIVGEES
jgi:hypothetical protein